uniref:Uncharacterized protein n=1 Tax=Anabas testudineus TaxID=64144 RepID=A0A7N6A380_ANATE
MAEDHSLGDGDGSIDVTEGLELLLLAVAQHIVLFDKQQHLTDYSPPIHICLPLDTDTLVLVSLCCNHDVSLIQYKHFDLLGVYELELTAPVQHGTRCANDNIATTETTQSMMTENYKKKKRGLTFISSDGVDQFDFRIVFAHLLNHLTSLKGQFIGR